MSFLGSIVNSIGGDRAPPPPPPPVPPKPLIRPAAAAASASKSAPASASGGPKNNSHSTTPSLPSTLKRKVEDDGANRKAKISRPSTPNAATVPRANPSPSVKTPQPTTGVASAASNAKPTGVQASKPLGTTLNATAKPPLKGSYAEMMARAKQSAEQRAKSQVGTIKHQETKKEKMSRLAERRRASHDLSKQTKTAASTLEKGDRVISKGTSSPIKTETTSSVKPKSAPKPTYKGTMGLGASKSRPQKSAGRKSRYDEYLGTDEEEDDDIIDDEDDDGYDSEGSLDDMEAGFDDVEDEEAMALRAAKEDDARELAYEARLKREKEERRKKLRGLAQKQR